MEITNNENIYKFIPPFLFKKSKNILITAINNLGNRDFDKKKLIIAGIYLKNNPSKLIGLSEMFDYKKSKNLITIGYRINEDYWHKGIASSTISLMKKYLCDELKINLVAYVMEENIYSSKALINNGFNKLDYNVIEKNWGKKEEAKLDVYSYQKH